MAEIINQTKTDKNPKDSKQINLEDYPKQTQTLYKPLVVKENTEKKRTRAGFLPGGINPYGKPHLIEDGRKIKS